MVVFVVDMVDLVDSHEFLDHQTIDSDYIVAVVQCTWAVALTDNLVDLIAPQMDIEPEAVLEVESEHESIGDVAVAMVAAAAAAVVVVVVAVFVLAVAMELD